MGLGWPRAFTFTSRGPGWGRRLFDSVRHFALGASRRGPSETRFASVPAPLRSDPPSRCGVVWCGAVWCVLTVLYWYNTVLYNTGSAIDFVVVAGMYDMAGHVDVACSVCEKTLHPASIISRTDRLLRFVFVQYRIELSRSLILIFSGSYLSAGRKGRYRRCAREDDDDDEGEILITAAQHGFVILYPALSPVPDDALATVHRPWGPV